MKVSARHVVRRGTRYFAEAVNGAGSAKSNIAKTAPAATHAEMAVEAKAKISKKTLRRIIEYAADARLGPDEEKYIADWLKKSGFFDGNVPRPDVNPTGELKPLPLEQPKASAEKGPVQLDDIDDEILAAHVAQREQTNPQFATALKTARTAFAEAASPSMELPVVAPKLWADNTEGMTATQFVAVHYKPWIEAGVLSLKSIKGCDKDLGKAYSNRISRHPDEAVALVRATRSDRIEDPQEAIDRFRKASRDAAAKRRAEQRDNPANTPA